MFAHHRFGMELDAEHFFLWTVYHIDASIGLHVCLTSCLEPETGKGIVLADELILSIRRYCGLCLHSLERLRELLDFESEVLADRLASEANSQKGSITAFSENLSQTIHLRVIHIVDIARSSAEDKNVPFLFFILSVADDVHLAAQRLHHNAEDMGEIIIEIDHGSFFSDQFRTWFKCFLFSQEKRIKMGISRDAHLFFQSRLFHRSERGVAVQCGGDDTTDTSSLAHCFSRFSGGNGAECDTGACRLRGDGASVVQHESSDGYGRIQIAAIFVHAEDAPIIPSSDFLNPRDNLAGTIDRASREGRSIQCLPKGIDGMDAVDHLPGYAVFGMDDGSRFAEKWPLDLSMWAESGNHFRAFIEEHGELLRFFGISEREILEPLRKSLRIADFHGPGDRICDGTTIFDGEMSLRAGIEVGSIRCPEDGRHIGASYPQKSAEQGERRTIGVHSPDG